MRRMWRFLERWMALVGLGEFRYHIRDIEVNIVRLNIGIKIL